MYEWAIIRSEIICVNFFACLFCSLIQSELHHDNSETRKPAQIFSNIHVKTSADLTGGFSLSQFPD